MAKAWRFPGFFPLGFREIQFVSNFSFPFFDLQIVRTEAKEQHKQANTRLEPLKELGLTKTQGGTVSVSRATVAYYDGRERDGPETN